VIKIQPAPTIEVSTSMKIVSIFTLTATLLISGCASVEMASKAESAKAKEFNSPVKALLAFTFTVTALLAWPSRKTYGLMESASARVRRMCFSIRQVEGGKNHKVDTESEFSPNTLELMFEAGKNYFIRQFIKIGVFVGGAGLEQISEENGKIDIAKLEMAKSGRCSAAR